MFWLLYWNPSQFFLWSSCGGWRHYYIDLVLPWLWKCIVLFTSYYCGDWLVIPVPWAPLMEPGERLLLVLISKLCAIILLALITSFTYAVNTSRDVCSFTTLSSAETIQLALHRWSLIPWHECRQKHYCRLVLTGTRDATSILCRRKTLWRRIIPDTCHWVGHNRHQIYAATVLDFLGNILYMVVITMPLSIRTLLIFHKIWSSQCFWYCCTRFSAILLGSQGLVPGWQAGLDRGMLTKYNSFPPFSFVAFTLFCICGLTICAFAPSRRRKKF